jgi:hypothetical protein
MDSLKQGHPVPPTPVQALTGGEEEDGIGEEVTPTSLIVYGRAKPRSVRREQYKADVHRFWAPCCVATKLCRVASNIGVDQDGTCFISHFWLQKF